MNSNYITNVLFYEANFIHKKYTFILVTLLVYLYPKSKHTQKQNKNISKDMAVLLNQKRANVCEHTTRMVSLEFIYIYIYIYIPDDAVILCCGTVWLHGWGISVFPETTVLTLLSVINFTGRPFPLPTFTGTRGAHKRHHGYNYSYHRVQNSYQLFWKPWFDITVLFLHVTPFQPSPISLLRVVIFPSVLLLILQNYKKIVLMCYRLAAFRS